MSARVRALVNVERPVVIIVDDAVTPAEEYLEIEFETHAEAHTAVERFNEMLRNAKGVTFLRRDRGEVNPFIGANATWRQIGNIVSHVFRVVEAIAAVAARATFAGSDVSGPSA
jgi:hypothetical protein